MGGRLKALPFLSLTFRLNLHIYKLAHLSGCMRNILYQTPLGHGQQGLF
jgi:hypothetical protein